MKRIVRILGLAIALAALLVVSIAGTVFAADNPENGKGNLGGECPYGDGTCEECEPKDYSWGEQEVFVPGPHGPYGKQYCKGRE